MANKKLDALVFSTAKNKDEIIQDTVSTLNSRENKNPENKYIAQVTHVYKDGENAGKQYYIISDALKNEKSLDSNVLDIGVELSVEQVQALKAVKLQELAEAFKEVTTKTGVTVSGVGIVDAGRSNLQDISGIIETFEESGQETMLFRIADNSFVSVNAEQLKAIKKAIILKGQELYQKKWEIEAKLANATTFDEIRAIKVEL